MSRIVQLSYLPTSHYYSKQIPCTIYRNYTKSTKFVSLSYPSISSLIRIPHHKNYNINIPPVHTIHHFSTSSTTPTSGGFSFQPVDSSTVQLLTSFSKWTILTNTSTSSSNTSASELSIPSNIRPTLYIPIYLQKQYEFRNLLTATRFFNQTQDILLRIQNYQDNYKHISIYRILPIIYHHQNIDKGTKVTVQIYRILNTVPNSSSTITNTPNPTTITQDEADLALRIDEIGAELQLGGQWN